MSMNVLTAEAGGERAQPSSQLLVRSRRDADLTVVRVAGQLDTYTVARFSQCLDKARLHRSKRVVIDLTAVTFVDSAGVRALVSASSHFTQRAVRLGLVCPQCPTLDALRACNLLMAFCVGQSVAEVHVALAASDHHLR